MTERFNLFVGLLTKRSDAAAMAQSIIGAIPSRFAAASSQDIELKVIYQGYLASGANAGPVSSDTLHRQLESMTGRQRGSTKVNNIGLLIADSYQPAKSFLGLMFDDAFQPGGSDPWELTPREGCAIFLDGIAGKRGEGEQLEEAIFTSIHELAHVFNLQHSPAPSFMYQSATGKLQPLSRAAFSADECRLLSKCSSSRFIHPGGSQFGDLGDLATSVKQADASNGAPVELTIKASTEAFWQFEPVELDVTLHAVSRAVSVPDALDIGYSGFEIWIDDPVGERRKLKSPCHYCSSRGVLTVKPEVPYRRDVSIFGESGGYTFRRTGIHKIWAEFEFAKGKRVQSNVIEIELLQQKEKSDVWRDAASLFAQLNAAQLLYAKRLMPKRIRAAKLLSEFCDTHRHHAMSAMAHFALGQAYWTPTTGRSLPVPSRAREARHHLAIAAQKKSLGDYRRSKAEQKLKELDGKNR